jgi:hypothetical protein
MKSVEDRRTSIDDILVNLGENNDNINVESNDIDVEI